MSPLMGRPLGVFVTNEKILQPCLPSSSPLKQTLGSIYLAIGTRLEPWRELRGESSLCGSRCISGGKKLDITRGNGESSLLYTGIMIAKWANKCLNVGFHVFMYGLLTLLIKESTKRDTHLHQLAGNRCCLRSRPALISSERSKKHASAITFSWLVML